MRFVAFLAAGAAALHSCRATAQHDHGYDRALVSRTVSELFTFEDPIVAGGDVMSVRRSADAGLCFVKVQGSDGVSDYMRNVQIAKRRLTSIKGGNELRGYGMKGFVVAYEDMRERMWEEMHTKCDMNTDIFVFTGHSRGGAVAQIMASVVYLEGLLPVERMQLITFGSPRALRSASSDKVHNKFMQLRFWNLNDPVPSVPPSWFAFSHIGKLVTRSGVVASRNRPESGNFLESSDHFLSNYKAWLTKDSAQELS